GVAVRSRATERDAPGPRDLFTNEPDEVVDDPDVRIVVEVMGGIEPARSRILKALASGRSVVTANKELLATLGKELFDEAERAGVDLAFEAAVAGGIPIIKPLKESLAGERIRRVMGIITGTPNFILTRMSTEHIEFDQALAEAKRLGYTELDPTADIEGKKFVVPLM